MKLTHLFDIKNKSLIAFCFFLHLHRTIPKLVTAENNSNSASKFGAKKHSAEGGMTIVCEAFMCDRHEH